MGFADPETVTLPSAGAQAMARTGYPNPRAAEWRTSDDLYSLFVSHDSKKRDRSVMSFTRNVLAADPYVPANFTPVFMRVQLILDRPVFGLSAAQEVDTMNGFITYLNAGSFAKALLLQGHSV
jgi:hypothetical protein